MQNSHTDNRQTANVVPIRAPRVWTEADSWREAEKLMGPRSSPDTIAAAFRRKDPAGYENWRRGMVLSAKRTLRSFRHDERHPMNATEFRVHMHRNYETAVVRQAYEELHMNGPRAVRTARSIHEKINRRGYAEAERQRIASYPAPVR